MCFSATASFLTSGVIGTAGIASLARAKTHERPVASFPLLFAIQQALEGIIWIAPNQSELSIMAAKWYIVFAYIFWPAFFPFAIRALEPLHEKKRLMMPFVLIGFLVALYGLFTVLPFGRATILEKGIFYDSHTPLLYGLFYALAVFGPTLLSTSRWIKLLGVLLALSLGITLWFFSETSASVWCFFAAVLSGFVVFHFYSPQKSTH